MCASRISAGSHGTRYAVDSANGAKLTALVESGRKKIRQYMLTHNVPEPVLKQFDMDEYKAFVHLDLPAGGNSGGNK
jgi:hypothetical protein